MFKPELGVPPLTRPTSGLVTSADRAELERLRKRVDQQEHSLTVLTHAVSVLRNGSQALREENRELRLQLQTRGRSRAGMGQPAPTPDPARMRRPQEEDKGSW